jgi:hypothetical protein
LVVVVRPGCEHCQELLEEHFSKLPPPDRFRSVFFVAGESTWSYFINCLPIGEASGALLWSSSAPFVASPAVFRLTDGRVVSAADGQEADAYVLEMLQ